MCEMCYTVIIKSVYLANLVDVVFYFKNITGDYLRGILEGNIRGEY